jgi:hypothetical protein
MSFEEETLPNSSRTQLSVASINYEQPPTSSSTNNSRTISNTNSITNSLNNEDDPQQEEEQEYRALLKLVGLLRLQNEMRQLGAVLLVLGIGTTFSTLALLAHLLEGQQGTSQITQGFKLPILVANLLQVVSGMVASATGIICILQAPLDSPCFHRWSKCMVAIVNFGPIALIITVVQLAMKRHLIDDDDKSMEELDFFPEDWETTSRDVHVAISMGILSLISVCATLIGGLTVSGLHICALQALQPHARTRAYHILRYGYYNILVMVGGMSYLVLGAYLWSRFGVGPYYEAVHVAVYTVHFPLVAVLVGSMQTGMGVYGFLRAIGTCSMGTSTDYASDHSFLLVTCITWIVTTCLQFVLEPAYGAGESFQAEGATIGCVYLGFFLMPAYLDHLVRTTPVVVHPQDYGLPADADAGRPDLLVKLFYGSEPSPQVQIIQEQDDTPSARDDTYQLPKYTT